MFQKPYEIKLFQRALKCNETLFNFSKNQRS